MALPYLRYPRFDVLSARVVLGLALLPFALPRMAPSVVFEPCSGDCPSRRVAVLHKRVTARFPRTVPGGTGMKLEPLKLAAP